ncbi:hypothetical protein [Methylobacterium gregans]|uniref:Uncharacterized protein n=1 Tax=Methylobacterium gregans TaxID=374424 RepID=A0AA37M9P8_9HYPH|nr:hypothetical protein [Methylobacterium gregans]MDQ0523334.1 hypothetical protein [Methylobacterium gregans]GJD77193.1 hypothetical protein NBEOAGPD_0396 [Methylobacterium gregans]GLS53445.1 hypothetical protein GCM10007886_16280 [Methylobacterium gregans]
MSQRFILWIVYDLVLLNQHAAIRDGMADKRAHVRAGSIPRNTDARIAILAIRHHDVHSLATLAVWQFAQTREEHLLKFAQRFFFRDMTILRS